MEASLRKMREKIEIDVLPRSGAFRALPSISSVREFAKEVPAKKKSNCAYRPLPSETKGRETQAVKTRLQ